MVYTIHPTLKIPEQHLKYMPYIKDINTIFIEVLQVTVRWSSYHYTVPKSKSILFSVSQDALDNFNLQIKDI